MNLAMKTRTIPRRIGEIILSSGYINQRQLDEALKVQETTARKKSLEELLAVEFYKAGKSFPGELPDEVMITNILPERNLVTRSAVKLVLKELREKHSARFSIIDVLHDRELVTDDDLKEIYKVQGERMYRKGLITLKELRGALNSWRKAKKVKPLGMILIDLKYLTEKQFAAALSKYTRIPFMDMSRMKLEPGLAALVPQEIALRYRFLPLTRDGKVLTVAMAFPFDDEGPKLAAKKTDLSMNRVFCKDGDFEEAFRKIYGKRMKWY